MKKKHIKLLEKRSGSKKAQKEKHRRERKLWNGYRPSIMQDKRRSGKEEQRRKRIITEEET